MISLSHYLVLGAILFAISIVGIFLNRKNVIILLMAIELMLLAVNMNFVAFSHYLQDASGKSSSSSSLRSRPRNRLLAWRYWWCCFEICALSTWMIWTNSRGEFSAWRSRGSAEH